MFRQGNGVTIKWREYRNNLVILAALGERAEPEVCIFDTGSDSNLWPRWRYTQPLTRRKKKMVDLTLGEPQRFSSWVEEAAVIHFPGWGSVKQVPIHVLDIPKPTGKQSISLVEYNPLISAFFLTDTRFCLDFPAKQLISVDSFRNQFNLEVTVIAEKGHVFGMYIKIPMWVDGQKMHLLLDTGWGKETLILNAARRKGPRTGQVKTEIPGTRLSKLYPYELFPFQDQKLDGLIGWKYFASHRLYLDTDHCHGAATS